MPRNALVSPCCHLAWTMLVTACSGTENTTAGMGGVVTSNGGFGHVVAGTNAGGASAAPNGGAPTATGGTPVASSGGAQPGGGSAGRPNATNGGSPNVGGGKANGGGSANGGESTTGGRANAGGTGGSASGGKVSAGTSGVGGDTVSGGAAGKPWKGVANSNCAQRTALNVSWYYNWETAPREPCSSPGVGGEYVPMIKGNQHRTPQAVSNAITTIVNAGYETVLGFNEPNKADQGNQTVELSISLWPSLLSPALRVGSPATSAEANPGQAWFTNFMNQINANSGLRVDFIAIHWYGWNAGSCDGNATQLENYIKWVEGFAGNRPIWITEFGCSNQSNPDEATVVSFFKGALTMFARHPRIERYAWYPWIANNGLVNADGTLTQLGTVFAAAPAHK